MNNNIEYLISQMNPGQLNAFINQSFPGLVGGNFMFKQGQSEQEKKRIVADKLSKAVASPAMDTTQESVMGSLSKYVNPEVQQGRSANIDSYSKFNDDSYNAVAEDYDDAGYDLLDDSSYAPSARNQRSAVKPSGVSQAPLDIAGVKNAIAQDPNWQPRNEYEKWALGQLQGAEWTPNPDVQVYNDNNLPAEKEPQQTQGRIAGAISNNQSIPKPVGIKTDLQTGLVYDYNRGLVFNPATGVTQKLISGDRTIPTKLEVPNLVQEPQVYQQPNSVNSDTVFPLPGFIENHSYAWNSPKNKALGQQIAKGIPLFSNDEIEQAKKESRQIDADIVDNQLTDGEGRFFPTAQFSNKRDYSVPDEYKRPIGVSSRVAQVNQAYSPEVMSRVGQNGYLNNAGSIILPNTWTGNDGNTVFSKGRGTATTIVYRGDKEGNAIPSISIPRIDGLGNELVSFEDAVKRQLISPEQYDNYVNQAAQTRFIPASGMDSFNRDNVKLYEATDLNIKEGQPATEKNYRATYMNPQTKEVFNVTQNGGFYLVRPAVSEESSGLPIRKGTTNIAQEMTDINRAMREGGRDNLVDIIREDPATPGLEAFTRPVPAINPITGETINKYVHTGNSGRWIDDNNPEDLFNYFNANAESSGQSMEALDLARGGRRTAGGKVTPAYPSLQETDYLGGRLAFNADGNIVDVPSQELAAKGINNFTPASEFYSSSPQVVRELVEDPVTGRRVAGRVLYSGQNLTSVRPQWIASSGRDGNTLFEEGYIPRTDLQTQNPVLRFKTNPETPLRAFNVNEYGVPIPDKYGFPQEVLTSNGEPIQLPRSAQIANKAEEISHPRLMVQDFKGITPDYEPIPDGMSYEEADRKGLLKPIFNNTRPVGLNSSYQIPLPKGVGLARVLDETDPRTQAALAAQAEAQARIAADTTIAKPAFDRKYTITPGRTAGIESPQYAQYTDLLSNPSDDTARFWKENVPGIIPQGVIDGAYLPVTVTPRPVNAEGKKGWLYPDQIYTTESGREVRGDKALSYVNVPLNLDNATTSYLPTGKRKELEAKGFGDDAINAWVNANPNLARDNALANAKILIDGQYYDVTPQATVPEFNPATGGNYLQAVNRSEHRAARIDTPFKAGTNISEPTPEWIQQQAISGNLNFNPDDYISPDDRAILNQKEIYNAGYEEPTDILGAINRVQRKKNQIDAVISNTEQRLKEQYGLAGNQVMLSNDFGTGLLDKSVGSVINGEYVTTSSIPDLTELKAKSNQLAEEINRASAAHNAIINIEDSPEITITRTGTYGGVKDFNQRAANELGMEVLDNRNPSYIVGYDNQERPLFESKAYGSLPNNLLPYEHAKALNQSRLLPAYRTQQKVKLSTVPTSNIVNLGRATPFPEDVITTAQIIPEGNQVVKLVPGTSENYQYRNGGNANYGDKVDNSALGMMGGMGFDGGSIPGDYVPSQPRTYTQQTRTSRTQSPNIPIEPEVRMTGGMNIPKWAIPATLGAVWLGLAANARRQQDEERRQQQGVSVR